MRLGFAARVMAGAFLAGVAAVHCGSTTFSVATGTDGGADGKAQTSSASGSAGSSASSSASSASASSASSAPAGITCLGSFECTDGSAPICCMQYALTGTKLTVSSACEATCSGIQLCQDAAGTGGTCATGTCAEWKCGPLPAFYACAAPAPAPVCVDESSSSGSGSSSASSSSGSGSGSATGSGGGSPEGASCEDGTTCAGGFCCLEYAAAKWSGTCTTPEGCVVGGTCTPGAACTGTGMQTCGYYECTETSPTTGLFEKACTKAEAVAAAAVTAGGVFTCVSVAE